MLELDVRKRNLYEIIENTDIITPSEIAQNPLIEGMIYPKDYVLLTAEEKVGKTILSQHITCALSMGTPLFGIFDIPQPFKTWYMATEVRVDQLKDRFKRISKHVGINTQHIKLIPTKFRFNTDQGVQCMKEIFARFPVESGERPQLIVIDALYKAIKGSLIKDDVVNDFHYVMDWIIEELGCAILLVHHLTKGSVNDKTGKRKKERDDKDTFGSTFLGAGVDHIFRLEKWHKNKDMKKDRSLVCETQRSELISENIRLRLVGPDPLYFKSISVHSEEKDRIEFTFKKNKKLTIEDIQIKCEVGRTKAFIIKKELIAENKIRAIDEAAKPIEWEWIA